AVPCGQVSSALSPCMSYLTGGGDDPEARCCAGV
nr:RecName: Full=Non-specific lipid-transfer protein; AltName: Full=McLTP1 [Morinda citrifolia]